MVRPRVRARLRRVEGHRFWADSVSIPDENRFNLADAGPKILTDLYLAGLAAAHGGRLVTFDHGTRWQWVTGCGSDNLEILQRDAA